MGSGLFRICRALAWALGIVGAAQAAPALEPLLLFNREVTELRAVLGGLSPAERVERAQRRFAALSAADEAQPLQLRALDQGGHRGLTLLVGDKPLFSLLEADLDPEERLPLQAAAERAQRRVHDALLARRAQREPATWLRGAGAVAGAGLLLAGLVWAATGLQRRLDPGPQPADATGAMVLRAFLRRLLAAALWLLAALLAGAALLLVFEAFPWSAPWAERLLQSVRHLGGWLVGGLIAALPGLLTVLLVAVVARALHEAMAAVMRQVQAGRIRVPFVHADTASATRRLLAVLIWGLALAVAYPYLPGSDSDAFKGLSVLFGLMVTLGSTGVVTQLMSGLVVVYSRALRKGDFVSVGGVEGVVGEVGALAVKITTMRNEEITVPNAVITGSAVHNYSKLAGQQGTLVSTQVTIGYDTPWRQVHAMLIRAALATPGVRPSPVPFVYQRALSDFYVQYELFAHIDRPLERVPILSAMHAAIQDEFNRHGVQIMSPHFYDQPEQAVLVPQSRWWAEPAARP